MRHKGSDQPDLWAGADVRWIGPDLDADGLRLRPGDRATVVDPGRYAIRSFAALTAMDVPRPKRSSDVVIQVADHTASVGREHLELVAPEHPLTPEPDRSAAGWWIEQLADWPNAGALTVASVVPRGFPAACRVLHPWGRRGTERHEPVRWAEVAAHQGCAGPHELFLTHQTQAGIVEVAGFDPPSHGQLDALTAAALLEALAPATSTPDSVCFAVWEGWGDTPPQRFPGAARLETPGRVHFLLRGPLSGALTPVGVSRSAEPVSGVWWPDDRAWFVFTEIDFDWTFVAGSEPLVDALLAHPDLEATRTSFDAPCAQPGRRRMTG